MKFLILQRATPEASVKSLVRLTPEQFSYLDRLKEEGKVDLYYHMVLQRFVTTIPRPGSCVTVPRVGLRAGVQSRI